MMTLEQIIADIKSDRVKKVIFDADAGNEIDDQYAIAYALSCENIKVLSMSGAHFKNEALVPNRYEGMMESWREIIRVEKLLGIDDVPVYKGCTDALKVAVDGSIPEVIPEDCEAVDNIIKTADEADELIYIMVTGTATNISSAIAKAPRIKDKICVIWLGGNCLDDGCANEYNYGQDPAAGKYLFTCGVPLVWLPAMSPDKSKGTQCLVEDRVFLEKGFPRLDPASNYFRIDLPMEHDPEYYPTDTNYTGVGKWWHIYWDVAAPAILHTPENAEFQIVDVPRIKGDDNYAFGEGNTKAIYVEKYNAAPILKNMIDGINSLIK